MKILKVINNNVVSACDDKGKEIVVMGKGLGFGKTEIFLTSQRLRKSFRCLMRVSADLKKY